MPSYEDKLLKEKEAAIYLNVAQGTLQIWRHRGQGPPYVVINKKAIRYKLSELIEYVNQGSVSPMPKVAIAKG